MATNTGFIDLMSFARGQELGNQMNWRDVINDINTRQAEQNLQMQQEEWALKMPVEQEKKQFALDALQANREGATWQASVSQQAAALPPEERSQFLLGEYNKRLRTLDPNTPAGAMQIRTTQNAMIQQGYAALRAGDETGARNIFGQVATMYNPLDAQAQQRAKQTEYFDFLNQQAPGMFVQNPVTGAPVNISELLVNRERLRQLGGLPGGNTTTAVQSAPAVTQMGPAEQTFDQGPVPAGWEQYLAKPPVAQTTVAPTAPVVRLAPTATAPYANVGWRDVLTPWSVSNQALRSDIANWMPQWLTAPSAPTGIVAGEQVVPRQMTYQPNVFGGGFR